MSNPQRVLIFGATSAIAAACARLWAVRGSSLFLVGRNENKLESLLADLRVRCDSNPNQKIEGMAADLNDFNRHEALFATAEQVLGGIDAVLIAQGSLPDQRSCEQSVALTMEEIRTNALGVISLLAIAANKMEAQGRGALAVISSVAGDRGRQSNYVYGAAKGMVTIFTQGLRCRLSKRGVAVITIKPGFVDTPMTAHFKKKGFLWTKPETVARGIVAAVEKRRDVVYLPWIWRPIMFIIRNIPETIFKRFAL